MDSKNLVGELRHYNSWMAMVVYHPDTHIFLLSRAAITDAGNTITLAFDFLPAAGRSHTQTSVIVSLQASLPYDLTASQPVSVQADEHPPHRKYVQISGAEQEFFLFFQMTNHFTAAELFAEKRLLIDLYGYGSTLLDADGMHEALADASGRCMVVAASADG